MTTLTSIIYAVGVVNINGVPRTDPLTYATVEKEEIGGTIGYVLTNRSGVKYYVGADSVDALIAALVQARGAVDPVTGKVA